MTKIPLLIDTDPGVDDALALLMAFNDPRHEVVGLTIAAGNVGLRHTVANALKLCEVAGVDVPVYAGCPVPLVHPAEDAAYVHGQDGFGDTGYAPAARQAADEHAALAIIRLSKQYAGRLLLVSLGPLTNLALALRLDPALPARIGRLVFPDVKAADAPRRIEALLRHYIAHRASPTEDFIAFAGRHSPEDLRRFAEGATP